MDLKNITKYFLKLNTYINNIILYYEKIIY